VNIEEDTDGMGAKRVDKPLFGVKSVVKGNRDEIHVGVNTTAMFSGNSVDKRRSEQDVFNLSEGFILSLSRDSLVRIGRRHFSQSEFSL